mmetsp:Transcript_3834/g.6189  ORF Transcript_3834/g.6189 Transcript_3834/m.6189 type:complete len:153 (-) Transcript_3834:75-533(-)
MADSKEEGRISMRRELHRAKKKGAKSEEPQPRNSKWKGELESPTSQDPTSEDKSSETKDQESPDSKSTKDKGGATSPNTKKKNSFFHLPKTHSDTRKHEQFRFEGSGILMECAVEIRGIEHASCDLDEGQTLRTREEILESTTAAGVKITRG